MWGKTKEKYKQLAGSAFDEILKTPVGKRWMEVARAKRAGEKYKGKMAMALNFVLQRVMQ